MFRGWSLGGGLRCKNFQSQRPLWDAFFKGSLQGVSALFRGGLCSAILKTRLLHRDPPRDHLMLSETISTLTLGEPNIDTACRTKSPVFRGVYSPSF